MINSIDVSKCTGCGTCFKTCGLDVFRLDTEHPVLSSQHGQMSGRYCPSLPKKSPPTVFTALLGGAPSNEVGQTFTQREVLSLGKTLAAH